MEQFWLLVDEESVEQFWLHVDEEPVSWWLFGCLQCGG